MMKNLLYILLFVPFALFGQESISYQLSAGWNMAGYTGCEITPIEEAFQDALGNDASLEETFYLIKDVRGIFWHQELGENSSLTHLTPGAGYMMYVNGDATTVSFSEEYCNDITYQLNSGWNMVGYTGTADNNGIVEQMDAALGNGEDIANTIQLIKNVSGQFWAPVFDMLGELTPGQAYMMYVYSGQQTTLSFTDNSTQVFENNPGVEFTLPVTDNNMSVIFPAGTLDDYLGGVVQAYVNGNPVSNADWPISEDGSTGVAVIGTDVFCGCDLADGGETIEFAILMNGESIVNIDVNPPVGYVANGFEMVSSSLSFTLENGDEAVFGCTNSDAENFDDSANTDNGLCQINGCTDVQALNYDEFVTDDDGSCIYDWQCYYYCCSMSWDDGHPCYPICISQDWSCLPFGCTDPSACNYDSGAYDDDGSCAGLVGCTYYGYYEFDASATCDDGSCASLIVPGCMDATALNYNPEASEDDGLCEYVILLTDAFWGADGELTYITANNMSVLIQAGTTNNLNSFNDLEAGDLLFAVYETSRLENEYLGYSKVSGMQMAGAAVWTGDQVEITIYGKDSQYDNGFEEGEEIVWLVEKADGVVCHVQILDAAGNDKTITWGNSEFAIVDGISVGAPFYDGCMNPTTPSYNPLAAQDDGSCTTPYSIGCMDENALNYAGVGANPTHDNAQNFGNLFGENRTYNLLTNQQSPSGIAANFSDDSYCQDQVEGCTDPMAHNYDPLATQNDATWCDWTLNGMTEYNVDQDGNNMGTDYNFGAVDLENVNDGILGSDFDNAQLLFDEGYLNVEDHVIDVLGDVMEWIDNNFQQISVDLAMGWNMIGYSCIHPISAEDALTDIVDEVLIMKDNNGAVYLPEYGFNGIGDLTPGHGYQLKVTDYILDFNICE